MKVKMHIPDESEKKVCTRCTDNDAFYAIFEYSLVSPEVRKFSLTDALCIGCVTMEEMSLKSLANLEWTVTPVEFSN